MLRVKEGRLTLAFSPATFRLVFATSAFTQTRSKADAISASFFNVAAHDAKNRQKYQGYTV